MVSCAALECTNGHHTKIPGLTFHRMPKDPLKRQLWINAIRRENWTPPERSYLCSQHFKPEDLDRTSLFSVRLRAGAVPSVFPGHLNCTEKVSEKNRENEISFFIETLSTEESRKDAPEPPASCPALAVEKDSDYSTPTFQPSKNVSGKVRKRKTPPISNTLSTDESRKDVPEPPVFCPVLAVEKDSDHSTPTSDSQAIKNVSGKDRKRKTSPLSNTLSTKESRKDAPEPPESCPALAVQKDSDHSTRTSDAQPGKKVCVEIRKRGISILRKTLLTKESRKDAPEPPVSCSVLAVGKDSDHSTPTSDSQPRKQRKKSHNLPSSSKITTASVSTQTIPFVLETPTEVSLKKRVVNQRKKIKTLQQSNRRLTERWLTLKQIINSLKGKEVKGDRNKKIAVLDHAYVNSQDV